MELIVLRIAPPQDPHRKTVSAGDGPPFSLEAGEYTPAEYEALKRDPTVAATVPPMPISLLQPVSMGTSPTSPVSVSWGVSAVKADRLPLTAGEGAVVAVLDTGIIKDYEKHPAFRGIEIETANFTDEAPHDTHGHGTHCAGTIFGRDLNGCRIGVAPGVRKAFIAKVLGEHGGSTAAVARALSWIQSRGGAHVISMSLGMDFMGHCARLARSMPMPAATSVALAQYIENVRLFDRIAEEFRSKMLDPNPVVVVASGNESKRPNYAIAAGPPATPDTFVCVGAVDGARNLAYFSNSGVRFVAPGVDIISAGLDGGLTTMSGTSMAAPHVAGLAAVWVAKLMAEGEPATPEDVIRAMVNASVRLPGLSRPDAGLGLVQAPEMSHAS
jgi:subtilisin family serine protease